MAKTLDRRRFLKVATATAAIAGASALGLDRFLNTNKLRPTTTATQPVRSYLETNLVEIDPSLRTLIPALDTLRRFPESFYSDPKNRETLRSSMDDYRNGLALLRQRLADLANRSDASKEQWNKIHSQISPEYDGLNWVGFTKRNAIIDLLSKITTNSQMIEIIKTIPQIDYCLTAVDESERIARTDDSTILRNISFNKSVGERYSYLDGKKFFYYIPGNEGQLTAYTARTEIVRQLGVHFSGSTVSSVDESAYRELLLTMDEKHRISFEEIVAADKSPYKNAELAHIVNVSRKAKNPVADVLANGIDTGTIRNVHLASHLVGPQVTPRHVGTVEDRFYGWPDKYNYSLIPPDHLSLSEIELAMEIFRRMPKFGYVTETPPSLHSSKDTWESGNANSNRIPIIFNSAMLSAGRLAFALGEYTLQYNLAGLVFQGHYRMLIPIRNSLMNVLGYSGRFLEPLDEYAKRTGFFYQGFYPFLSGSLTLFIYDPVERKFTFLNDEKFGYSFETLASRF